MPAAISEKLAAQARDTARRIADALDYVGVLAVEMFVVPGDEGPQILVNEIAPRVHNSGHWTLDGASISQFEQHIRAIAGWPLGKPLRHGEVTMTNLIGDEINNYGEWLAVPGATVHLYGKGTPRPGRKMGHVTQVVAGGPKNSPLECSRRDRRERDPFVKAVTPASCRPRRRSAPCSASDRPPLPVHRRSRAPPRIARAGPAPTRRRTKPARCCAPGLRRYW